jgi:hypothetical protein
MRESHTYMCSGALTGAPLHFNGMSEPFHEQAELVQEMKSANEWELSASKAELLIALCS